MQFEEILVYLREGHKVRRTPWPADSYLMLKDGLLYDEDSRVEDMVTDSIFLDDWELFKEEVEPYFYEIQGLLSNQVLFQLKIAQLEEKVRLLEKS